MALNWALKAFAAGKSSGKTAGEQIPESPRKPVLAEEIRRLRLFGINTRIGMGFLMNFLAVSP
jgi:hypothetical protein